MTAIATECVLQVRHWTDSQFTLSTTRRAGLRFENGQFLMLGIPVDDRPLLRAYSIASANHEDQLDFLSIKVPDGPLTSRLQHIRPGDPILVSLKPTGTLLLSDLRPGKRLFLLCTGTGVAPFMSIVKDPEVYDRFEEIILVHGVRWTEETAVVADCIDGLREHEVLGESVRGKLRYCACVTREPHPNRGRITTLIESGALFGTLDLPPLEPGRDRLMVCGNPEMLSDTRALLDARGFQLSARIGDPGDYVIERAFVER